MLDKVILLVEDNPDDQALTERALKKNNIANTLVIAQDGEEALDYIFSQNKHEGEDNASQIAVVLLDLKLPTISGFEVLKRIREDERTKLIPVVILTSSKEELDVMNGYKLGANSYIRKPVEFEEFTDAVKHLGVYWLILNELPQKL